MLKAMKSVFLRILQSENVCLKEAGISFQYFSNSYILKDKYCHCLTSDATIMVSYKFPIDLFTDTAAILNSEEIMGCPGSR